MSYLPAAPDSKTPTPLGPEVSLTTPFPNGMTAMDALGQQSKTQFELLFANLALCERDFSDPLYAQMRDAIDVSLVELAKGKWLVGRAIGLHAGVDVVTRSLEDLEAGITALRTSETIAAAARAALSGRNAFDAALPNHAFDFNGTETLRADGIPLLPSINPVVVLQGSSKEMGYQYAEQLIDIFGPFILSRMAAKRFSAEQYLILRQWEAQLEAHAPEMMDFCLGWAEGASANGVPMAYENVLALWTSDMAPARETALMGMDACKPLAQAMYAGGGKAKPVETEDNRLTDMCSGVCAWGEATTDGELAAIATTDHDCFFQATIVAYPDDGHPFIYTPFAATGWLPGLGSITMGGMPGMNAAGVSYVHHGGGSHMLEPKSAWGYGIRRGVSIMHLLQNFSSAKEMRDQELAWPIGDVGGIFGNPGAFYADKSYGYVLESRMRDAAHPRGLIREGTYDANGALNQFLFATNNSQHPDAGGSHCVPVDRHNYDLKSGWTTLDPNVIGAPGEPAEIWHRWWTKASEGRNRFLYDHLFERCGRIDTDWLARLYRTQGEYPSEEQWEARMADFKAGGAICGSSANRGNAFVAIMEPRKGSEGLFKACIGPAARGLPPKDASHGFYYYDETAAFWTIRLADSPMEMVKDAKQRASADMAAAGTAVNKLSGAFGGKTSLEKFQRQAHEAFKDGCNLLADSASTTRTLSKALRAFTRAQVRANQIIDAVHPPQSLQKESSVLSDEFVE